MISSPRVTGSRHPCGRGRGRRGGEAVEDDGGAPGAGWGGYDAVHAGLGLGSVEQDGDEAASPLREHHAAALPIEGDLLRVVSARLAGQVDVLLGRRGGHRCPRRVGHLTAPSPRHYVDDSGERRHGHAGNRDASPPSSPASRRHSCVHRRGAGLAVGIGGQDPSQIGVGAPRPPPQSSPSRGRRRALQPAEPPVRFADRQPAARSTDSYGRSRTGTPASHPRQQEPHRIAARPPGTPRP